ncbi:E3 ubiquitin-protein ligase at4g11680-like protein [Trifolium pratense]|uniref:E3 ubiquitin-protein ligase at4g11680-like protein n=1 Tax=Trifolium pratense TaxID=57577 RepID=A0A2K3NQ08_TRIPR|nr:E3 ubiquitin-protein ligase at4g11680-like protein [Trifolium pratense]
MYGFLEDPRPPMKRLTCTEDVTQTRGATSETINALPTYKFKTTRSKNEDESSPTTIEGGIVAEGTEKERMISGEDAVCCICILNYENEDELRELPCSHLFHKECVDKWLKINALCPLCKSDVGGDPTRVVSEENSTQQRGDSRVENSNVNTSSL